MKPPITFSLFLRVFICSWLSLFVFTSPAFAQKTVSKTTIKYSFLESLKSIQSQSKGKFTRKNSSQLRTNSILTFCDIYLRDSSSSGWGLANRGFYTHDSLDRFTSRTVFALNGEPLEKDSIGYDSNGKEFINANYKWFGTMWVPQSGYMIARNYNSNGKEAMALYNHFQNGSWQPYRGDIFNYNSSGNLAEIRETNFINPNQNLKRIFSYNLPAGLPTEITYQKEINGSWINDEKHVNISWHDFSKMQPASLIAQRWSNNAWEDYVNLNVVFDSLGGYVYTEQLWNNGAWENAYRYSEIVDSKGNYIGSKDEEWLSGSWQLRFQSAQVLTYNQADDIIERIYRDWDFYHPFWRNQLKEVYTAKFITGLKNHIPLEISATIYPNPTEKFLNIEIPENTKTLTAQLSDLTGKIILNRHFKTSEQKQLNLENLNPGIYLLQLETEKGKTVRKVLKN